MASNKQISLLFQNADDSCFTTRLLNALSIIFVALGLVGNLLCFRMFFSSRRFRQISSTYAHLATGSSIMNCLCVIRYAAVLHSTARHYLQALVGQKRWACKFYEFSCSFRLISSWIIVFWMAERLIRSSKILQTFINRWFLVKLIRLISIFIGIVILTCVIVPPVYMFEPQSRYVEELKNVQRPTEKEQTFI